MTPASQAPITSADGDGASPQRRRERVGDEGARMDERQSKHQVLDTRGRAWTQRRRTRNTGKDPSNGERSGPGLAQSADVIFSETRGLEVHALEHEDARERRLDLCVWARNWRPDPGQGLMRSNVETFGETRGLEACEQA